MWFHLHRIEIEIEKAIEAENRSVAIREYGSGGFGKSLLKFMAFRGVGDDCTIS